MDTITLQTLLALAMFATTALAGLVPIKLLHLITRRQDEDDRQTRRAACILTLLSCFAGGVFMGTCFLDIFPHINENYERFLHKSQWTTDYPFPQFFVCCGFFLVYLLEELCLKVFTLGHGHGHSHGHSHPEIAGKAHRHGPGECTQEPLKHSAADNGGTDMVGPRIVAGGATGDSHGAERATKHNKQILVSSLSLFARMCCPTPPGDDDSDSSTHSNSPFKQRSMSVLTHELVIDESLKYMNSGDPRQLDSTLLKSLTFAVAMSFHSVLEGFALGVQDNNTGILTLFVSLIIHKGIEAFSVGLQITRSNSKRLFMVILTIIVYALMTPLGSLAGVLITNMDFDELAKDAMVVVLESLAGGTFIYVTFFEVLAQERANDYSNLVQLGAIVLGFLVISALQVNEQFAAQEGIQGH